MRRTRNIEVLRDQVQAEITNCITCQPFEGGEAIWIFGSPIDLDDLLSELHVPEDLWDEVCCGLRCPHCGADIDRPAEVGTKFEYEIEHAFRVESAEKRYSSQLQNFSDFIQRYPYLGATHRIGRRLLKEIAQFPKTALLQSAWFRSRRPDNNKRMSIDDLRPPDPRQILVPEGRFNHSGSAQWYLASTPTAAAAEILQTGDAAVWVQEWEIDRLEDILDLRAWDADGTRGLGKEGPTEAPLLALALIFGDYLTEKPTEQASKPEYVVPRFVAEAARIAGFSGIIFKSARHPDENLVVFDRQAPFVPIGEPRLATIPKGFEEERDRMLLYQGFHVMGSLPEIQLPQAMPDASVKPSRRLRRCEP